MKKTLLLFMLMVLGLTAFGQTPEDLIDQFFTDYEEIDPNTALDNLYATNNWVDRNQDAIENVKAQLGNLQSLVGDYYGYEPITTKSAGKSFVLHSFLVRYDRQPIRFTFEFYKPKDTWRVFSFSFDEDLDDEVEEAAKAYRLPENYK